MYINHTKMIFLKLHGLISFVCSVFIGSEEDRGSPRIDRAISKCPMLATTSPCVKKCRLSTLLLKD